MQENLSIWPDWELQEQLDSGSCGVVYRACHRNHPELQSAVKLLFLPESEEEADTLRGRGLSDEQIRQRYLKAAEAYTAEMRRMELFKGTSHIVSVEDFSTIPQENGIGWIICIRMELLKSLNAYLSDKQLSEDEIIRIGIDLCSALEVCHREGVIHRDIKPANIFVNDRLSSGPLYKLGDFGASGTSSPENQREEVRGTPLYMAPEVVEGQANDERSDLYSLGLTLYQLANNGRLPFLPADKPFYRHEDKAVALHMRMKGMPLPDPDQASDGLAAILRKACAFDPESRYADAGAMKAALTALQRKRKQIRKRQQFREKQGKWLIVALVIIGIIAAGVILFLSGRYFGEQSRPEATALPLTPVATQAPSESIDGQISFLQQSLAYYRVFPEDDSAYRVPLSLNAFSAVYRIQELCPIIETDSLSRPGYVILSDGSPAWEVSLNRKQKNPVSFYWEETAGQYIPSAHMSDSETPEGWLLFRKFAGDWRPEIELHYSADSVHLRELQLQFCRGNPSEKLTWYLFPEKGSGFPCRLETRSADKPPLVACYGSDVKLRQIQWLSRTYTAEDSGFSEIEGVELIP